MEDRKNNNMEGISQDTIMEYARTLRTCAEWMEDQCQLLEQIKKLREENDILNTRLEKAKEVFRENKAEIEYAEIRARTQTARNLQKSRDEIYNLGYALHAYAVALSQSAASKMTLVEVNNLQASLADLINNLAENGLWEEGAGLKPDLSQVEKVKKPRTPRKPKAKKEETVAAESEHAEAYTED